MKIEFMNESNLIIYLNKLYAKTIDFDDREEMEDHFKDIFLKLKNFYHITICGYYSIDVYIDDIYGAILEINKEELEYFDYFDNEIDMRIVVHNIDFLYQLDEYIDLDRTYYDTYFYKNKWFVKIKKLMDNFKLGQLLEQSQIYYDEDIDTILKKGILIDI